MKERKLLALLFCAFLSTALWAGTEDNDTTQVNIKVSTSDRNVMLNAESGSAPRSISFGLPTGGNAAIREDGMALAYGNSPAVPYFHWAGGNSYGHQTLLSVPEATILAGDIGFVVDSFTKLGGETTEGAVTFGTSTNGLIKFDGALSGKISDGWYYSTGAYLNYDPTSVNTPTRTFIEQKQIYRAAISRRWDNASVDLLYKFAICNDGTDGYAYAPFIYNGDGSISTINGFVMGRDSYVPVNDAVEYMDVFTGQTLKGNLTKMDRRHMHDIMLKGNFKLRSGWVLDAQMHFSGSPKIDAAKMTLAGIDKVNGTLTLEDGTAYSGYVQNRLVNITRAGYADFMNQVVLSRHFKKNYLRAGLNAWYDFQHEYNSTFNMAHTVEANPDRLFNGGKSTWSLNRNSTYYDGEKGEITGFIIDEFDNSDRLTGRLGLRAKWNYFNVNCAVNPDGQTFNTRTEGFFIDNGICQQQYFVYNLFDYAATISANYRIAGRLFASGEGLISASNKGPSSFKSAGMPEVGVPSMINFIRGGLMYDNSWMDATVMLSYVSNLNSSSIMSVTKQINGVSETIPHLAYYGIGTVGLTTEANVFWGGFKMHGLLTLRNPRYMNYENVFEFSDGQKETISYTGNFASGISRVELELDPSYTTANWRFWGSARYYSRQYASRTNLAYFNGHWETFAGIDRKINEKCKLSLNFVNLFFQNGAKGSIDVADTITDPELLKGIVMAGSYIRPFTIDFSITMKF